MNRLLKQFERTTGTCKSVCMNISSWNVSEKASMLYAKKKSGSNGMAAVGCHAASPHGHGEWRIGHLDKNL